MATITTNLSLVKAAWVDYQNPNTPCEAVGGVNYRCSKWERLLLGFSEFPSNLKRNKLIQARIVFYCRPGTTYKLGFNAISTDWSQYSVTWRTMPTIGSGVCDIDHVYAQTPSDQAAWGDRVAVASGAAGAKAFVNSGGLATQTEEMIHTGSFDWQNWYARVSLAGGGMPYVEVTMDTAYVTSKVTATSYPTGTKSIFDAQSFAWKLEKNGSDYCADETWYQSWARVYWKASTESSWHYLSASGSTMSLTAQAGTFPPGSTIQWYIQCTDTDGTTTSTATQTFTTATSTITPSTYPSGTSVDNRSGRSFSWYFSNGFSQRSAALKWRVSGGSWNTINASGTTSSLTVPAYTFPTGATIQWYLTGVDNYGHSSTSDTKSFTVASASVVLSSYPSGSNIYTKQTLTFTWDISGTLGSYTQRSAVLYWKKQQSSSYTAFSVSGSTKRAAVPANTFPTGSTIQWYVYATDSSGVSASSAVQSFSTVTPAIAAVTYPSGNDINFGAPITFTWKFTSAGGEHDQSSAIFYWRANTTDNWTPINISGGTKAVTVPAYTFPSNKTISWYLQGTDVGGTTSQTNTATFKTASPKITPQSSPTSGYMDPRNDITFSWYFTDGTNTYDQRSASLKWRVTGETNWTTVDASGTTQHVTVAANTFPTLTSIEWYLIGTDRGGTQSQTTVYTFSTTAETAYAICLYPVGRVEDGTKPITFTWTVRNADGSLPTRIIMKWKLPSESASEWRTVLDTTDQVMTLTMPADTFSAGAVDWEVIAYNRDDVAGPASVASFVCIAAPDPPVGLTATAVPRTTVTWQPEGQEAYEVRIDGKIVEAAYGPGVYSYRQMEPLTDGVHLIQVRIQGVYGLWSNYAETTISVENIPDGTVTLAGKFRVDAKLDWTYDGLGDPEVIAIYRDDQWIGRATGKTVYSDRYALGQHLYHVEYWYASGYYTRSEPLKGKMSSDTLRIGLLNGTEWISLELSTKSSRTQQFKWNQSASMLRITASRFPVLETAPYETESASYECAFRNGEAAAAFENLRGETVVLKSREGSVMVGGLVEMSKTVSEWHISYSFTVQRCHWEDFVNDDADD